VCFDTSVIWKIHSLPKTRWPTAVGLTANPAFGQLTPNGRPRIHTQRTLHTWIPAQRGAMPPFIRTGYQTYRSASTCLTQTQDKKLERILQDGWLYTPARKWWSWHSWLRGILTSEWDYAVTDTRNMALCLSVKASVLRTGLQSSTRTYPTTDHVPRWQTATSLQISSPVLLRSAKHTSATPSIIRQSPRMSRMTTKRRAAVNSKYNGSWKGLPYFGAVHERCLKWHLFYGASLSTINCTTNGFQAR